MVGGAKHPKKTQPNAGEVWRIQSTAILRTSRFFTKRRRASRKPRELGKPQKEGDRKEEEMGPVTIHLSVIKGVEGFRRWQE